jgi:hypothetical protein
MADEQLDRLESFRVFITVAEEGAAIPPVAEHDLKCLHELCVERANRYCGKDGVVSIDSMARACSPDANLPAVWLRHALFYRQEDRRRNVSGEGRNYCTKSSAANPQFQMQRQSGQRRLPLLPRPLGSLGNL